MPKRSNPFQKLIAIITDQLAPTGATVHESLLHGPGKDEIDVTIELTVSEHPVKVGIECRDHKRKGDKTWINEIIGKHQSLGIHRSVAVHSLGFSKGAEQRAAEHSIQCLTLAAAEKEDWRSSASFQVTEASLLRRPRLKAFMFIPGGNDGSLSNAIWLEFGGQHVNFAEYLGRLFDTKAFVEDLSGKTGGAPEGDVIVEIPLAEDTLLVRESGSKVGVSAVALHCTCFRPEPLTLSVYRYGDSYVLTALDRDRLTHPLTITQDSSGVMHITAEIGSEYIVSFQFEKDIAGVVRLKVT